MLSNFIRLTNYMIIETLVKINLLSMGNFVEELNKLRKNGMFTTTVFFGDTSMMFIPTEDEI